MSVKLNWGIRLEALADALIDQWIELSQKEAKPFGKVCIVVSDKASENWLKQYMLMDRKLSRIMMNVEFAMLPQFINDWLSAQVKGVSPRERCAVLHPYSKEVLAWRIYRILSIAQEGGELDKLLVYLNRDRKNLARRRYALSARLARLYDDYLNSRFQMLNNWEMHIVDADVPEWQPALYRILAKEDFGSTYAQDYAQAFQPDVDADKAQEHGFPNYMAIHVFDAPFMSEPTLRILERISEASPMTFWMFTPKVDWLLDTPSEKEVRNDIRRRINTGSSFDEAQADLTEKYYDSADERLLGSMASGARAVLGALFDDTPEGPNVLGEDAISNMFAGLEMEVHRCYSPRRELEAVKDSLHKFFAKGGGKPHDAIVLCGDWDTYAPIIETVFNPDTGKDDYMPITVDKGTSGDTPLTQSFKDLLTFDDTRFEVSAVFGLLSVPAIRSRLDLDEKALDDLKDMVSKANIHWGADDDDVARILEMDEPFSNVFTWERGLDRLIAEMLYGFPDDNELLINLNEGHVHPVGHVEAQRANALAQLWHFIEEIKRLKKELRSSKTACQIKELLLDAINRFYDEASEHQYELTIIRNAINGVFSSIEKANMANDALEPKVFVAAVMDSISNCMPGIGTPADSVLIAPLKSSYAMPRKYVWICGLGEGSFPHNEHRFSFDIIGRHPNRFDSTSKDRDAFALLKASLGAREKLCFSYVGMDVYKNEKLPSSALLNDLMDYLKTSGIQIAEYTHPLHSYSRAYFQQENKLPDTYSKESQKIAELLAGEHEQGELSDVHAFTMNGNGIIEMNLSDLEAFYTEPRKYVFEQVLGIKTPYNTDYQDTEQLDAAISKKHKEKLALEELDEEQLRNLADLTVETGEAANTDIAMSAIEKAAKNHGLKYDTISLADAYEKYQEAKTEEHIIELQESNGRTVHLKVQYRTVEINGKLWSIFYIPQEKKALDAAIIRHIAYNVVGRGLVSTLVFGIGDKDKTPQFLPAIGTDLDAEAIGKGRLAKLVELACRPVPRKLLEYGAFAANEEYKYSGASTPNEEYDEEYKWEEIEAAREGNNVFIQELKVITREGRA